MSKTRDKLLKIEQELNTEIVGRPDVIRTLLLSTLANQHVMLIGPPGNAKTLGFEAFFRRITGAKIFNTQIHAASSPDEVLGPASIRTLRDEDRIERNFDGMFPWADYAVMDEFWNMPETLAGSMLRALNEREVFDGTKFQKIPLRMMVVASNKLPYGEGFLAALDRIVCRIYLPAPKINEQDLFEKILHAKQMDKPTKVSLKEIDAATSEINEVPISDAFYDFISRELRPTLTKMEAGLSESSVSPRRWKQGMMVARAQAWLCGDDEVKPEHAIVYKDIVWNKEPQIEKVRSLIGRLCGNPSATIDGNTLRDEVKAIVEGHASDMQKATELGDSSSAAAAVTNKTKLWNNKLKEVTEDWHERFRKEDDYSSRTEDLELASQMMASCAQRAYSEVMES